jgi:hypothetical protein
MKKLSLSIISCMLAGCSLSPEDLSQKTNSKTAKIQGQKNMLEYAENPFNARGKEYAKVVNSYLERYRNPNSIDELTHQIQFIMLKFARSSYVGISSESILLIKIDPKRALVKTLQKSSFSTQVKGQLTIFIEDLINGQENEFFKNYNYIQSFEKKVLDSKMTANEKENILSITSISAYALEVEKKRKDKDWETAVGNKKTKPFFYFNQNAIISIIALMEHL